MLFYFSLGILISALGAQVVLRSLKLKTDRREIPEFKDEMTRKKNVEAKRREKIRDEKSGIRNKKIFKWIFFIAIIFIFLFLFYQSYQQYQLWLQNEFSKYFLPPYQNIDYFLFYIGARFFAPYLVSLAVAVLFLFAWKTLNKKYNERFFESEEFYLGALAIFLTNYPGWIFYLIFLILIYLLIHLYQLFIIHNSERISLYYLWIPAAISVIIIGEWLRALQLWSLLKI